MPCNNCDDCTIKGNCGTTQWVSCKRCGLKFFDRGDIPPHICLTLKDQQFWSIEE